MTAPIKSARTEAATLGHGNVVVAATATRITAAGTLANFGVRIKAAEGNAEAIYIGGAGVTTGNGYPLAAGEELALPIGNANDVYAISASGNQNLRAIWC